MSDHPTTLPPLFEEIDPQLEYIGSLIRGESVVLTPAAARSLGIFKMRSPEGVQAPSQTKDPQK